MQFRGPYHHLSFLQNQNEKGKSSLCLWGMYGRGGKDPTHF